MELLSYIRWEELQENWLLTTIIIIGLIFSYARRSKIQEVRVDLRFNNDSDREHRDWSSNWCSWGSNIKFIANVVRQRLQKRSAMKECRYCEREYGCRGTVCASCRHKKYKYRLTDEEMYRWLEQEECSCCGNQFKNHRDKVQDHCHSTGDNRGIVCQRCNIAIGYYETTNQRMLVRYLNKFN